MKEFTDIFNKLQSVIQVVGQDIKFPRIVVVGSQVITVLMLFRVFSACPCSFFKLFISKKLYFHLSFISSTLWFFILFLFVTE